MMVYVIVNPLVRLCRIICPRCLTWNSNTFFGGNCIFLFFPNRMSMSSECTVYCYSDEKHILFWVSRKTMGDQNSNSNILTTLRHLCVKKKGGPCGFKENCVGALKKQCGLVTGRGGGTHSSYWTFCKLSEFHSYIKYEFNNILYDHKMCLLLSLSWNEEISQSILPKIINKQPLIVIFWG